MKTRLAPTLALAMVLMASVPDTAAAQTVVDAAYGHFVRGDYKAAYNLLRPYAKTPQDAERVDFMLAVSMCRLGGDLRPIGLELLETAERVYRPTGQRAIDYTVQVSRCQAPSGGLLGAGSRIVLQRRGGD